MAKNTSKTVLVSVGASFAFPSLVDAAIKTAGINEDVAQRMLGGCRSALGEMNSERQSQKFTALSKVAKGEIYRRVNTVDKEIGVASNPLRFARWVQQVETLSTEFPGMTVTLPTFAIEWSAAIGAAMAAAATKATAEKAATETSETKSE